MNCDECNKAVKDETALWFAERANKRQFIVILLLIISLVASNVYWVNRDHEFETIETWQEVTQDSGENGYNNFVGGDYYGEAKNQD